MTLSFSLGCLYTNQTNLNSIQLNQIMDAEGSGNFLADYIVI